MEREKERLKIEELERRLDQEIRKNELVTGGLSPVCTDFFIFNLMLFSNYQKIHKYSYSDIREFNSF